MEIPPKADPDLKLRKPRSPSEEKEIGDVSIPELELEDTVLRQTP